MKVSLLLAIAFATASCSEAVVDQSPPPPPALKLSFGPFSGSSFGIMLGASMQIYAQVVTSRGTIVVPDAPPSFVSRSPNIVAIEPDGHLTAIGSGFALLVAEARVGSQLVRDSVGAFVVCTAELRISLTPAQQNLQVGERFVPQLSLTTCGGQLQVEDTFTWASTDPSILAVDPSSGETTGLRPGAALVTVSGAQYRLLGQIRVTVQ